MPNLRDDFFDVPPLSADDQRLVDIYVETGRPLDRLPYTGQFDELVKHLGFDDTMESKYRVYQRLLGLRKRGRLPRLIWGAEAS